MGYGRTFVASGDIRMALVPIGYEDGYDRRLSNRATMQVRARNVPVIGRVSMDQTAVDVTGVPDAAVGDGAGGLCVGDGLGDAAAEPWRGDL